MSLRNPTMKSPATRYFRWAGGAEGGGRVTYYDKSDETEHEVKLPFRFTVLDEVNTVGGYSDSDKSSFWSNEVRDITKDTLTVRTIRGVRFRGKYSDMGEVKSQGAKYAKSVYIAFKDDTDELVIGNIKFMGAALAAWIDFNKKFDISKCAVEISGGKKAKKGATVYYTPIIDGLNLNPATLEAAKALDRDLQTYLERATSRVGDAEPVVDDEDEEQSKKDWKASNDAIDNGGKSADVEDDEEIEKPKAKEAAGIPLKNVDF